MSNLSGGTTSRGRSDNEVEVDGGVRLDWGENNTIAEAAAVAADKALELDVVSIEAGPSDEATLLERLTEGVRDQDDLQRDIAKKAKSLIRKKEDEGDQKRIEKARANVEKLLSQKRHQKYRLDTQSLSANVRKGLEAQVDRLDANIALLEKEITDVQLRVDERHNQEDDEVLQEVSRPANRRLPNESHRDFLIRTGKITPFFQLSEGDREGSNRGLTDALLTAEDEAEVENSLDVDEPQSHQNLRLPGFAEIDGCSTTSEGDEELRRRKRRRLENRISFSVGVSDEDAFSPVHESSSEGSEGTITSTDDLYGDSTKLSRPRKTPKRAAGDTADLTCIDDGNEAAYQRRLKSWITRRSRARKTKQGGDLSSVTDNDTEEWFKPSPDAPDHYFGGDLKLPGDIYPALFDYQKTGVQWLGELHSKQVGGIIGDEMGLGKTIQMISFLAGLHYSNMLTKPVIVVAPATVLRQWVNEFHRWWPPFRVSILHTSGSGMFDMHSESLIGDGEDPFESSVDKKPPRSHKFAKQIVHRVVEHGHILVTTYAGLQTYGKLLIPIKWAYAILDEGHKIRNPNSAVTVYCKELQTPNRIILSGTPMQNNLVELWSLFDFVYPMRLGTLVDFKGRFEVPIRVGGYANATNMQIVIADKCAQSLKDAISPYLLQRLKADVAADLPKKSEQVLFCKLTKPQREAYEVFLRSEDMKSIIQQTRQPLYGIDILRKICNHPDLLDPSLKHKPEYKWGNPKKSGKMQVVKALLEIWKKAGDKVLLFSQGVLMLNIIEEFVKSMDGFNYLRMDGSTSIKDRQSLVDRFNNESDLHVFLLTTKVGGLGVNLTGANRVIIFDPDWNPSTDVQARERAWRLGQKKEVSIYRLMAAGTIEEKIYHRQIFKQFLTDKVLKDSKLRQSFDMGDLYNLFTLGPIDGSTETGTMFKGTEVQLKKSDMVQGRGSKSPGVKPLVRNPDGIDHWAAALFDESQLHGIDAVASVENFHGDNSESEQSTERSRFLDIFASNGVHSVLEHERVLNPHRRDLVDMERHAERIASSNEWSLRKAVEVARDTPIGIVTWTGQVGEAGRPAPRRGPRWRVRGVLGATPSSDEVLSNIAHRQRADIRQASASSSGAANGVLQTNEFVKLIRDYIRVQGGSVPTNMLLDHFNPMCKTPKQSADFKFILQSIAIMRRPEGSSRMRGRWELKPEHK
jgi:DNA excision repair protein ERCC-6